MQTSELLTDGLGRVRAGVARVLDGIAPAHLTYRPDESANTIAWLVWHLTRIQDDHVADAADTEQMWTAQGWVKRFGLPFNESATGYGDTSSEVAAVGVAADLLLGYHEAAYQRTGEYLNGLRDDDLDRVVDDNWDPPVTLGVRLISVVSDNLQHVGQAAYVRGLAERAS